MEEAARDMGRVWRERGDALRRVCWNLDGSGRVMGKRGVESLLQFAEFFLGSL